MWYICKGRDFVIVVQSLEAWIFGLPYLDFVVQLDDSVKIVLAKPLVAIALRVHPKTYARFQDRCEQQPICVAAIPACDH